MVSLQALKIRIRSVESTRKVTKAMKMIAATSLRRVHSHASSMEGIISGFSKIFDVIYDENPKELCRAINGLYCGVDAKDCAGIPSDEKECVRLFLVFTSDRGLCGHFNASIIKAMSEKVALCGVGRQCALGAVSDVGESDVKGGCGVRANGGVVRDVVICVGRVGYAALKGIDSVCVERFGDVVLKAHDFSHAFVERFESKMLAYVAKFNVVECIAVYNAFTSVLQYKAEFLKLWPLDEKCDASRRIGNKVLAGEGEVVGLVSYEPDLVSVLDFVQRNYMHIRLCSVMLSSMLSEYSARMVAMENANRNSEEIMIKLQKKMNKIRQETITDELTEIIAGVQAMDG